MAMQVYMPVTAVLGLLVVEVFPLQTLLMLVVQVVHDSERQLEPLAVQAVCPVLLVLPVLTPLLEDCSGKVEAVAAVVPLALAVLVCWCAGVLVVVGQWCSGSGAVVQW